MASPADPAHFVRIFGQPARQELGDARNDNASMRQALMMLNSQWALERAEQIAARIGSGSPPVHQAVTAAYRIMLGREPSGVEVQACRDIFGTDVADPATLADLCHVLLNSNEFIYVD